MDIWLPGKVFCKTWGSVLKIICIVQGEIIQFTSNYKSSNIGIDFL
jgi:hypothetical protein